MVTAQEALAAGAPQLHAAAPGNLVLDFAGGDEAATNAAFASAAQRREALGLPLARGRQPDGAARRHGLLRCGDGTCTTCTRTTQGVGPMRGQLSRDAGRAAGEGARRGRGSRRRLRRALQRLPGVRRAAARGEEARPPGEMGRHALGSVPRRRAGARHRATRASWRWTRTAASSACASTTSPTWAPTSPSPARSSTPWTW